MASRIYISTCPFDISFADIFSWLSRIKEPDNLPWLRETLLQIDPYCNEQSAQNMIDGLEDDCLVMGMNCGIHLVDDSGNEATFDAALGAFHFNHTVFHDTVQHSIPSCSAKSPGGRNHNR